MNIVCLLEKDAQKIVNLYKDNFSDGWNLDMIISAYKNQRFIALGAFINDQLIGAITCDFNEFDADIEGIVVKKEYRNKGVGALLISELEKKLKETKKEKIFLMIIMAVSMLMFTSTVFAEQKDIIVVYYCLKFFCG